MAKEGKIIKSDLPFNPKLRVNPIHSYIDLEIEKVKQLGIEVSDTDQISKIRLYLDSLCRYPFPSKDFLENSIFIKKSENEEVYIGFFRHNSYVEVSYLDLRKDVVEATMFTDYSLSFSTSHDEKKKEKNEQKELEKKQLRKVIENNITTQQLIQNVKLSSPETHALTDLELIEVAENRKFFKDTWETDLKLFSYHLFKKLNRAFCLEKLLANSGFELFDFSNNLQLKKKSKSVSWECGNIWLKHKKCGRVFKLTPQNRSFFEYKNCKSCTCISKDEMRLKDMYHSVNGFIDNYQDRIIVSTWGHYYYNPKRKGSSVDNYIKFRNGKEVFIEVQGAQHIENQDAAKILKQVNDDLDKIMTINKYYPGATMIFMLNTDNLRKLNEILTEPGSKGIIKEKLAKIYNPSSWKNIKVKFIDLDEFECSFLDNREETFRNFYNLLME